MEPMAGFDELHVISDLHIGGVAPYQIFDSGKLLGKLVDHLRDQPTSKDVALLINGDTVDFLAEPDPKYLDPVGAVAKLDRMFEDPAFKPVWEALQRFVAKSKRHLIFTLGNHDLELALPWVAEHLRETLSQGNDRTRGRITFAFDGAGYLCRVGRTKVLSVHGNDVDTWNVTDYEKLRRLGRDLHFGRQAQAWIPNAGTKLVIDVMNDIKREYPFVDLLKPELEAVVPTLVALKPELASKIGRVMAVAKRLAWDQVRRMTGFLDEGEDETTKDAMPSEVASDLAVEALLQDTFDTSHPYSTADALLREAEERIHRNEPIGVGSYDDDQFLGMFGSFMNWIRGRKKSEILREALERVGKGQRFDLKHTDSVYKQLDDLVGGHVDFLLSGHTHLRRALIRSSSDGFYYNSGTWVRLIRLTSDVLGNAKQFERIYKTFEKKSMEALDKHANLVLRTPTVVSIVSEGAEVVGKLQDVELKGHSLSLTPVSGSEFTRS